MLGRAIYIGGLCIDTKLWNGPRALLWSSQHYLLRREVWFGCLYMGIKRPLRNCARSRKALRGVGGGTPGGDGETELNRPPIPLPQSVNASHAELRHC